MIAFVLLFLITLFVAYANGAPTPANRARHEHSPLVHASGCTQLSGNSRMNGARGDLADTMQCAITSRTFIDASRWRVSR
jgi:hypothetical protein